MADTTTQNIERKEFQPAPGTHENNAYQQNGTNGNPQAPGWGAYGGNPLAQSQTTDSARLPPFAGYLQPGTYRPPPKGLANPAPLGLAGFALTTFVLSLINFQTRGVAVPNIVVGLAFGYGGLVQLLAGMWEMAAGNTFGATALSSYGGFWISFAIILTPGGFDIAAQYENPIDFNYGLGFYLMGWFIFTFLLWICTLKSTVVFSLLFFWLWIAFLCLGLGYLYSDTVMVDGAATAVVNTGLIKAGGMFGLLAAFFAWWAMIAGIADKSNSFFLIPVMHFPWSEHGRAARGKTDEDKMV